MRCLLCGAWISLASNEARSTRTLCAKCIAEETAWAEMGMEDYAEMLKKEDEAK